MHILADLGSRHKREIVTERQQSTIAWKLKESRSIRRRILDLSLGCSRTVQLLVLLEEIFISLKDEKNQTMPRHSTGRGSTYVILTAVVASCRLFHAGKVDIKPPVRRILGWGSNGTEIHSSCATTAALSCVHNKAFPTSLHLLFSSVVWSIAGFEENEEVSVNNLNRRFY